MTDAEDGRTAVEIVRSMKFDLVVLDSELPGVDGLGVLCVVGRRWSDARVIVMSAGPAVLGDALELGAAAVVEKTPTNFFANFRSALAHVLDR